MKSSLFILGIVVLIVGCGGVGEKKESDTKSTIEDITQNPDYQKGLELTGKSDCFTCHKIDEKNIGPAWRDVANKYATVPGADELLAKKIIAGGSGVWGDIPMAAHLNFSEEDAKTIARYILLMKSN